MIVHHMAASRAFQMAASSLIYMQLVLMGNKTKKWWNKIFDILRRPIFLLLLVFKQAKWLRWQDVVPENLKLGIKILKNNKNRG